MPAQPTASAAVVTGPSTSELRDLPLPEIAPDAGLLRVEAAGVCGTDVRDYPRAELPPRVMGHEIVGTVERLGEDARLRWPVREGTRVLLEEYLPCGQCPACRSGDYRLCPATDIVHNPDAVRYGATPLARAPGLWGGYAQYLYLHPRTVFHRVDPSVDPVHLTLAIPLSNGYEWAYRVGGIGPGECCVVLGPGQQGLACVVAAKMAGAAPVVIAGLGRDVQRLRTARDLGADVTVDVEQQDLVDVVRRVTGGAMASVVVDTAAGDAVTTSAACHSLRQGGTLVLAARQKEPIRFEINQVRDKALAVRGVRGHSYQAVEWALGLLAAGWEGTEHLGAAVFALKEIDDALVAAAGAQVVHACVDPWR